MGSGVEEAVISFSDSASGAPVKVPRQTRSSRAVSAQAVRLSVRG